jgi:HSP20 family protein
MIGLGILTSAALGAIALDGLTASPWPGVSVASIILIGSLLMFSPPAKIWRRINPLRPAMSNPTGEGVEPPLCLELQASAPREPAQEPFRAAVALRAADDAREIADPEPPPEIDPLTDALPFTMAPPECVADRGGADMRCKMDLAATREGLELTIELPGLGENDVDIQVVGEVLTISGELRFSPDFRDKSYRLVERDYGAFSRSINLPEGVRADKIRAELARGVLTVTIPNPVSPEPRRIEVHGSPMRLTETDTGLQLTIDVPGVRQDDVEVAVCEGVLSVRSDPKSVGRAQGFCRSIELPQGVDAGRIHASMSQGVLTVSIPSPSRPEPRRIEVLASEPQACAA